MRAFLNAPARFLGAFLYGIRRILPGILQILPGALARIGLPCRKRQGTDQQGGK